MVKAYILLKVRAGSERIVFNKVKQLKEAKDVNELYGGWDIIVKIEIEKFEDMDKVITDKIRSIPGIKDSSTMIVAEYLK